MVNLIPTSPQSQTWSLPEEPDSKPIWTKAHREPRSPKCQLFICIFLQRYRTCAEHLRYIPVLTRKLNIEETLSITWKRVPLSRVCSWPWSPYSSQTFKACSPVSPFACQSLTVKRLIYPVDHHPRSQNVFTSRPISSSDGQQCARTCKALDRTCRGETKGAIHYRPCRELRFA